MVNHVTKKDTFTQSQGVLQSFKFTLEQIVSPELTPQVCDL